MHIYILNAYSFLIRTIACISERIGNKTKQTTAGLMIFILCLLGIIRHLKTPLKELIHCSDRTGVYIGAIVLLVLLIVSAEKNTDYRRINVNRLCLYGWLLCFITIFIMSFINPVRRGYLVWSIVSLLISVPFMMICAFRDNFPRFCNLLARVMTLAACFFVIINLLLGPFIKPADLPGYFGLMINPNGNGMICTGLYAASFFLLLTEEKETFAYSVITGFCIAFCFASDCRTAQLAIALESIIGMSFYLRCSKDEGKKFNIKKALMICAVIAITAFAGTFILTKIGDMDLNAYAIDDSGFVSSEAYSILDQVSSSRFHIWREYLYRVTFWGNGSPQEPLISEYEPSLYAHNNAIEILYTSGVPAFIGYVIFLISGIAFVLRCIRGKNGYKKEHLLVIMAFTGYFVEAMLEIVMYPMCHMPAILLNLCMMPIFIRNSNGPDQTALTTGGKDA